jgi:hypothetical protein
VRRGGGSASAKLIDLIWSYDHLKSMPSVSRFGPGKGGAYLKPDTATRIDRGWRLSRVAAARWRSGFRYIRATGFCRSLFNFRVSLGADQDRGTREV